jgi:hypothetical protein
MIDLNKEAEEYVLTKMNAGQFINAPIRAFIAGANSKYVEQKILEAQLDILNRAKDLDIITVYNNVSKKLELITK